MFGDAMPFSTQSNAIQSNPHKHNHKTGVRDVQKRNGMIRYEGEDEGECVMSNCVDADIRIERV